MKRLTPVVKEIGDNKFYIRPFSAFTAANMTGDLANVATPILAAIAPLVVKAVGSEDKKVLDTDVAEMAPSMQGAFSGLSGDKLERLSMKLLIEHQNISVETPESEKAKLLTKDLADELFCGEVEDMFVLMSSRSTSAVFSRSSPPGLGWSAICSRKPRLHQIRHP